MLISRLRYSVLNSTLILLLACGCSYPGYKSVDFQAGVIEKNISHPGWFSSENESLFNTLVEISGNRYSGLLAVKSGGTENHRIVMITEFGLKIFDMEFLPEGQFILHYCMEAINKKLIVDMLRSDFELMFMKIPSPNVVRMKENSSGDIMIKAKEDGKTYRFFIGSGSGSVSSVVRSSLTGRQARVDFSGAGGVIPSSVNIKHFKIRININLELVNESITASDE